MTRPIRLAYLVSHPIQYQAPLLRRIAQEPGIELTVFFGSDFSVRGYQDEGFGVEVKWDVPLLDGYRYEFLPTLRDNGSNSTLSPICHGLLRRLAGRQGEPPFDALWVREMSTGAYLPRWLPCDTEAGEVSALAFVIDRTGSGYVPRLPEDDLVRIILRASGTYGPCVDYVLQTAEALKACGICDDHLDDLARRLLSGHR